MIFKHLRNVTAALGASLALAAQTASAQDEALLAAYEAYKKGDAMALARHAGALEGHVLAPWLEYWRAVIRIEDLPDAEAREFFARHPDSYVADRLRRAWLAVLARREAWRTFDAELGALVRDDPEVRCLALASRLARGDREAVDLALESWLAPRDLSEGCDRLAERLAQLGRLDPDTIWLRARALFEAGRTRLAAGALSYLPRKEAPDERLLAEAARRPERVLARLPRTLEERPLREVVVLAALRLARSKPRDVAEALEGALGSRLTERDRKYVWGRVALWAARRHYPEALEWYERAADAPLADEHLEWKARAALRAGRWQALRDAVDRLSAQARSDPAWTYWYGRALAAQGNEAGARAYYQRVAGQTDFYSLLATEELGYLAAIPEPAHVPSEAEVDAARREPGLARALELFRLGLRLEGVREWVFTIRRMDDRALLAAAELARRAEVWDRAINTADKTSSLHNFRLRYLAPFHEVFGEYARGQGLEPAWVLGLVRQESRFIVDARSSAGAQGLMQLMPRTARYVARRIGFKNYHPRRVMEVETNVTLGTGYLKMVLDDLGHPVLAAAAYNAGPGRARRWRDERALEGAIYAETIPLDETRDYVKKVMSNAVFYAALEGRLTSLKERMGRIPAKARGERFDEELP
jgi:soluble lytic murein transglycosylase